MNFETRIILGAAFLFALFVVSFHSSSAAGQINGQDGPVSVTYGNIYQKGDLKFESYDLSTLPPLPSGYGPLNKQGYLISTTAMVSGPHTLRFRVPPGQDEKVFKDLRIFHAEPDTFDPDNPMWVDRTIAAMDASATAVADNVVVASSEFLGVFVIGKLEQKIPPSTAVAELVVTSSGYPSSVVSPNKVTFTVKVTNNGPQTADQVGVINGLSPGSVFISAAPSQGTCKARTGSLYCKLGTLAVGATATIQVIVKPYEGYGSFPREGMELVNSAWAASRNADSDKKNNSSLEYVRAFPDPNQPPRITLDTPLMGDLFVGPADISIKATAKDSDGSISKVDFFDNGKLVGSGTSTDGEHFLLIERNTPFGQHNIWAVATDDGGRENSSNGAAIITVNGSADVRVTSPANTSMTNPGSDLTMIARAAIQSGVISKVEFFVNYQLVGEGVLTERGEYTFSVKNVRRSDYSITAVATDGAGITTTSAPIRVVVSQPPTVAIVNPSENARFPSQTNLSIKVKAAQSDGRIIKVDLYANDKLIGSASDIATDQFYVSWQNVQAGVYSLTAVATDDLQVTGKSMPVKVTIEDLKGNHSQ